MEMNPISGNRRKSIMMRVNANGFSLVELLVVIAIIGIISGIALPSYIAKMPHRRLQTAARDLYGAMQQARLLAVKENRNITIRVGTDFYYIDRNNNNTPDTDEKLVNLSRYNDVTFGHGKSVTRWDGSTDFTGDTLITFTPAGTANGVVNVNDGFIYLQNKTSPSETFAITVQTSGAIKIRWFDGKTWK
jgi:type II secretion system protein H